MDVDINFSTAELVLLAEHLSLDPRFAVGERTDSELDRLKDEGWRSLLVRRFVRLDGDSAMISNELALIAQDVLAPPGLLTYTRIAGEEAEISHVLVGRERMLSATPIADDVAAYADIGTTVLVDSILDEASDATVDVVCRLEYLSAQERESGDALAWIRKADGTTLVPTESDTQETTNDGLREAIQSMVEEIADRLASDAGDS